MVEVVVVFVIVGVVVVVVIIRFVFRWCGFFPLQSRVDSFHSAMQCVSLCLALLWILSTSEPCGFLPLRVVLLVVIVFVVDIVQRSKRREQPQESRCRQPDVVNSVAISALDRI
jgi:uncharacterized membrane protein